MTTTAAAHDQATALLKRLPEVHAEVARRAKCLRSQFFLSTGRYRRELYSKSLEFFRLGAPHSERAFMAANRVGKSNTAAFEVAYHLTGDYPEWWPGFRFEKASKWWVAGETALKTRDTVQAKLCGSLVAPEGAEAGAVAGGLGSGFLPESSIKSLAMKGGLPGAIDMCWVQHVGGHLSQVGFKSYGEGRTGFDADTIDGCWFDEEPPSEVYVEAMMRTMTTGGLMLLTFTPLQGLSPLVMSFMGTEEG